MTPLCRDARIHGLHTSKRLSCHQHFSLAAAAALHEPPYLFGWKESPFTRLLLVSNFVSMVAACDRPALPRDHRQLFQCGHDQKGSEGQYDQAVPVLQTPALSLEVQRSRTQQ